MQIKDFPFRRPRATSRKEKDAKMLAQLREYKEKHGHCDVQSRGNGRLGEWVHRVKQSYKKGLLADDLQRELDEMGLSWNHWEKMYKELRAYSEEHGHCCPTRMDGEVERYSSLQRWVSTNRAWYKIPGKLSAEQIALLNAIGFDWDPVQTRKEGGNSAPRIRNASKWSAKFQANYDKLRAFKEEVSLHKCALCKLRQALANFISQQYYS